MKIKKYVMVIYFVAIMVFCISCNKKSVENLSKLVISYVPQPLNVPSIIIMNQKEKFDSFFKDINVETEFAKIESGTNQTMALASGDVNILNSVGGSTVVLAAGSGLDIKIFSMYSRAPKAFMMFSNNPNINTPNDLVGKKIAGPKGTNLHELLVAYLKTASLTEKDVEFISMEIPDAVAALQSNSVDVALVGGAPSYMLEKAGKHKVCDGVGLIPATICVCTTEKFYKEHKDLCDRYVKAQNAILDYIKNNYEEAMQTTATSLGQNLEAIKAMYAMYEFDSKIINDDVEKMKETENFLYEAGLLEKHVDVKNLFVMP